MQSPANAPEQLAAQSLLYPQPMHRHALHSLSLCLALATVGACHEPEELEAVDDSDDNGEPFGIASTYLPDSAADFDIDIVANRLLEDDHMLGGELIGEATVQAFLEHEGSFLAGYTEPESGLSAAAIITDRSHTFGISPLYMLARIQVESSLISSGTDNNLDAATGCGCPDSTGCNPEFGGFGNQIECAAQKTRGYFDDLDAGLPTIAGWAVGESKSTLDPCTITPANKATAALYTYTPWVGTYAEGCGRQTVGGSSLAALVFFRFRSDPDFGWPL